MRIPGCEKDVMQQLYCHVIRACTVLNVSTIVESEHLPGFSSKQKLQLL